MKYRTDTTSAVLWAPACFPPPSGQYENRTDVVLQNRTDHELATPVAGLAVTVAGLA